ncbi:iron-containing alcohol dehydrogenase [Mesoterricola silvestris]|uniref:NADH-dependent alcohol dehydrogenase n=1 Tax=Mesoterricola silvestris TaxID=2927979 RepID=A0AA48K7Z9_9BACT|nr:iron-containing alcohol dehydrogenase [Mesoterricola silvestris]BDU71706.1 NADH-dependent alcohol dehydrogenase [Mesoterricola silvestris]
MQNFTFCNPTKILFGKGRIQDLAKEIPAGQRVLVTYGGGSALANGTLGEVREALRHAVVTEFGGIEPNPSYETLCKAVKLARETGAEFLLAVGGGSVMDGTKFIAAAVPFTGEDPWDLVTRKAPVKAALPFGTVLTMPATGSEMNSGAVITRRSIGAKLPFGSPLLFPRFSVLDPEKTYSLPPRQIGNGIVDAFVHTVEQYLTYPADAPMQDEFSEGILRTLIRVGPRTLAEPENYEARAAFVWAATLALNGLIGAGVPQDWATHMIGHELTALHGLDHAQSLAVVLPAMLEERFEAKKAKLVQYADRVWGLESPAEAIEATRTFFESLGVKTRLKDYGVSPDAIPALLEALKTHGMTALGERRDVTLEVSRRVLERAL